MHIQAYTVVTGTKNHNTQEAQNMFAYKVTYENQQGKLYISFTFADSVIEAAKTTTATIGKGYTITAVERDY